MSKNVFEDNRREDSVFEVGKHKNSNQIGWILPTLLIIVSLVSVFLAFKLVGATERADLYYGELSGQASRCREALERVDSLKESQYYQRKQLESEIKKEHLKWLELDPTMVAVEAFYIDRCYGTRMLKSEGLDVTNKKVVDQAIKLVSKDKKARERIYEKLKGFFENESSPYQPFVDMNRSNYHDYTDRLLVKDSSKTPSTPRYSKDPERNPITKKPNESPRYEYEKDPRKAPTKNTEPNDDLGPGFDTNKPKDSRPCSPQKPE